MNSTPTEIWLKDSPLPALENENEEIAERLVLLTHYGVDFNVWGNHRRVKYWDALTERVKASTYAGPSLTDWWEAVSRDIVSQPRNDHERLELTTLLSYNNSKDVLKILRDKAQFMVLRVRVIAETRKNAYEGRENNE